MATPRRWRPTGMKWRILRASVTAPSLWGRLRPGRGEPARWMLFALIEGMAELLRRHLQHAPDSPLPSGAGAIMACACWTYVAHGRFAFRGVLSAFRPRLYSIAPFLAVSWGAADFQSLIGVLGIGGVGGGALGWALGGIIKYMFVRAVIWPHSSVTERTLI